MPEKQRNKETTKTKIKKGSLRIDHPAIYFGMAV